MRVRKGAEWKQTFGRSFRTKTHNDLNRETKSKYWGHVRKFAGTSSAQTFRAEKKRTDGPKMVKKKDRSSAAPTGGGHVVQRGEPPVKNVCE